MLVFLTKGDGEVNKLSADLVDRELERIHV
jgi:hypothetical protein